MDVIPGKAVETGIHIYGGIDLETMIERLNDLQEYYGNCTVYFQTGENRLDNVRVEHIERTANIIFCL